jgi:hypothetical protein
MNHLEYNTYGEITNFPYTNTLTCLYFIDSDISRYNTFCSCGCIVNKNLLYYHKSTSPLHKRLKPTLKKKSYPTKKITKDNINIVVKFD